MLPVSNDTLLRVVRRRGCPAFTPPTVIGIDDWAWRRNQRYGTIICDLERRRPISLLPDREPATAQAWLAEQPQIAIVARDRGGGYTLAAAKALPHATQVADRWHLMENASHAFLDAVRKSMRQVRASIGPATINPELLTAAERIQYEGYLRREDTNAAILKQAETYASGEGRGCSGRFSYAVLLAPIPGQELVDALGGMIRQPRQHVGEPGLGIDIIELGGGDQRVDGCSPPATFVGAREGPIAATNRHGTQLALGGIVRHAQSAVVKEASECSPALEAVIDGFAGLAVLGDPCALLAQPGLQCDDEWAAALMARSHALLRRQAVDLALDCKQGVDARDCLPGDRRLVDASEIEELAPPMRLMWRST